MSGEQAEPSQAEPSQPSKADMAMKGADKTMLGGGAYFEERNNAKGTPYDAQHVRAAPGTKVVNLKDLVSLLRSKD